MADRPKTPMTDRETMQGQLHCCVVAASPPRSPCSCWHGQLWHQKMPRIQRSRKPSHRQRLVRRTRNQRQAEARCISPTALTTVVFNFGRRLIRFASSDRSHRRVHDYRHGWNRQSQRSRSIYPPIAIDFPKNCPSRLRELAFADKTFSNKLVQGSSPFRSRNTDLAGTYCAA
jgi:hypothetical protein